MQSPIAQLKKLQGKSLREIRVRSRQEIAKFSERLFSPAEMTDEALLNAFSPASRSESAEESAARLLERIRSSFACGNQTPATFFPALARREQIVSEMERRFPATCLALIERADRAMSGCFDLLGFRGLGFGSPVDWHLEPLSGKRVSLDHWSSIDYLDPAVAGDKKITWELNRHAHFVTFGQAYWLTNDEAYAEAFVAQASSWMDANPPGRGINWASSLELAFRLVSWLWALHLMAGSQNLNPRFIARLLKYIVAHGRHIETYLSYYFSPNTHLTGEALGLFYLGTALPELKRAALWRKTGLSILIEQLPIHIRPDGIYFEQTTYYHRYTADFYLHLLTLARAGNLQLPGETEARLICAIDYLTWTTRPDGASPLVGDDDGGQLIRLGERAADDFRDTIATGAALFGRGDWKFVAGNATAEMLWLAGPETMAHYDEVEPREPATASRAFADSGYFVMRDGWSKDSSFVLVDCGPHGVSSCGHSHADALSFEFAAEGSTWLVDPGTFTYTGDAQMRDRFRSTEAHNTVTIDGEPQSIPAGPFSWKSTAKASAREFISAGVFDYFEGSHDGYERLSDPVTHTRSLMFVKATGTDLSSYLMVRDAFKANAAHAYAARYHCAQGCRARANASHMQATDDEGNLLNIIAFGNPTLRARIDDGWVSRAYGSREQAPVALIEARGDGPQELFTFILPGRAKVERAAGGFIVTNGESLDAIIASDSTGDVKCDGLTARALIAVGRFARGKLVACCFVQGKMFEAKDQFLFQSPTSIRFGEALFKEGELEITIHGASRFELSFYEPPTRISVNKTSFTVSRNCHSAAFALEGAGWKLASEE